MSQATQAVLRPKSVTVNPALPERFSSPPEFLDAHNRYAEQNEEKICRNFEGFEEALMRCKKQKQDAFKARLLDHYEENFHLREIESWFAKKMKDANETKSQEMQVWRDYRSKAYTEALRAMNMRESDLALEHKLKRKREE
jgi:hypothetical protein